MSGLGLSFSRVGFAGSKWGSPWAGLVFRAKIEIKILVGQGRHRINKDY